MLFPDFPDDARLWLFATDRDLADSHRGSVHEAMKTFALNWRSHGRPVVADAALIEGRVLAVVALLAEGEVNAGVSGCGIDSLQNAVDAVAKALDFEWASGLDVVYRDSTGAVQSVSRPSFRGLAQDGSVSATTPVFDLTLTTLGALRQDGVERPAHSSWHGRVFRFAAPAGA